MGQDDHQEILRRFVEPFETTEGMLDKYLKESEVSRHSPSACTHLYLAFRWWLASGLLRSQRSSTGPHIGQA